MTNSMKLRWAAISLLPIGCALLGLTGCGSHGNMNATHLCNPDGSPAGVSVTISPQLASVPEGTSVTLTETTTGAAAKSEIWIVGLAPPDVGSFTSSAFESSAVYMAPPTPPIYYTPGSTQGKATVEVWVTTDAGCVFAIGTTSFVITAPQVTAGISPTSASVGLGTAIDLSGYAVGNVDNGISWQVNGVTNGSPAVGTIGPASRSYFGPTGGVSYTAPATMPMSGPNVTITVVSQADPTKTASAAITLH